jgi:DMSO/TMAO reductase YedYZ molybdopterin-dependent catalytic subunit
VVRLTGDVRTPRDLTPDELAALPQRTVAVE